MPGKHFGVFLSQPGLSIESQDLCQGKSGFTLFTFHIPNPLSYFHHPPIIPLANYRTTISHDYLLPLTDLATQYSIPVLFYDQLGNGHSTHLPSKNGDTSFWTESLFIAELDNLIDHLSLRTKGFDILGQSWGGMLGAAYAALRPKGLRKLVISNSPASMETWLQALDVLRKKLPEDVQAVIERCEREQDFESEAYESAVEVFYKRHVSLARPWKPKELVVVEERLKGDPTVYGTMYVISSPINPLLLLLKKIEMPGTAPPNSPSSAR